MNITAKHKKRLWPIVGFMVFLVGFVYAVLPFYSIHYKVTVTVDTPEGEKTGYAVREISNGSFNELPGIDAISINPTDVEGEAVVVDLGERGVLFALISEDHDQDEFYQAFGAKDGNSTREGVRHFLHLSLQSLFHFGDYGDVHAYTPYMYVMFTDINDPESVVQLVENEQKVKKYKEELKRDRVQTFKEAFGDGVSYPDATLQMTDDPLTWRVRDYLPWIDDLWSGFLDGQRLGGGPHLSNILHVGYFAEKYG